MKAKQHFSLEEHQQWGSTLKVFRNEQLLELEVALTNRYGRSSKAARLAFKAREALDALRWEMENVIFNDVLPCTPVTPWNTTAPDGTNLLSVYHGTSPGA